MAYPGIGPSTDIAGMTLGRGAVTGWKNSQAVWWDRGPHGAGHVQVRILGVLFHF